MRLIKINFKDFIINKLNMKSIPLTTKTLEHIS